MRYTIASTETDRILALADHLETADGVRWAVVVTGEGGKEQEIPLAGAAVRFNGRAVEITAADGSRRLFPAFFRRADGVFTVATALGSLRMQPSRGVVSGAGAVAAAGHKAVKSSMPGKVLKLLCKPGDRVEAGQPLLIIEAMKMENEIGAPHAGVVEAVSVQIGQKIESGELLVKLKGQG